MTEETQNGFAALGLPPILIENLAQIGVAAPKPIQEQAIAPLLQGRDILAIAQTGSGKTFAFSLPILAKLIGLGAKRRPKAASALILTPTRELAVQIEEAARQVTKNMHLRIGLVLGGVSRLKQIKQMAAGVDMLIATPGRLMDHAREGNIDLSHTRFFVLDEADRMLDMGFIRDVRAIAARLAKHRQTALFSATMPENVAGLAGSLLHEPIRVETAPQGSVVAEIHETVYAVPQKDKKEFLTRLLAQEAFRSVIVFARTKHGADGVMRFLSKAGCAVDVIHGNKSQNARQRALDAFRKGQVRVLVATDIAARGIDVPGVSHVVNYEFPVEAESYVHRIGRTGRNGAAGDAVTLYDAGLEAARLRAIARLTGKKLPVVAAPVLKPAVFPKIEKPLAAFERPAFAAGKKAAGRGDKPGRPPRKKLRRFAADKMAAAAGGDAGMGAAPARPAEAKYSRDYARPSAKAGKQNEGGGRYRGKKPDSAYAAGKTGQMPRRQKRHK